MLNRRVEELLSQLSQFTSIPNEITRQTYSTAWEDAVLWVSSQMKQLHMQTDIDGFGNLIGVYNPNKLDVKPVGIGSHIDTVINGGAYDGAIGIIVGLEIVRMLQEKNICLPYPIEVIAFAEDEGSVFGKGCMGSEYITAHTSLEQLSQSRDQNGRSAKELAGQTKLTKADFGSDYGWGKNHFRTFCEVHAEQGPFLQDSGKQIGIVDGIVGILRSTVTFQGQPNHAGTTQMTHRKDAMVALAQFILQSYEYGISHNGQIVITNGKIDVTPNLHNVIPGTASSVMEMRAERDEVIQLAYQTLKQTAQSIAQRYQLEVTFSEPVYVRPVMFAPDILHLQDDLYGGRENITHIFSWAGHDAKLMSTVAPCMMLFVPSQNGMSHCPEEYSSADDIAAAADVLLELLRRM